MVTAAKPAVAGAISYADLTATLPTDASSAASGFTSVGYISDAGVTRSTADDVTMVKSWDGKVVCVLDNGYTETFKFAMIDSTSEAVLKLAYGDDNVTGAIATGITAKSNGGNKTGHEFIIDMVLGDGTLQRICIPNGVITARGDVTYIGTGVESYEVTITAIADASGNTAYDYFVKK